MSRSRDVRDGPMLAGNVDGQRQLSGIINPDDSFRAASLADRLARPDPNRPVTGLIMSRLPRWSRVDVQTQQDRRRVASSTMLETNTIPSVLQVVLISAVPVGAAFLGATTAALRPPSQVVRSSIQHLSLIHISEPTRRTPISYAVFCLKKKKI